jgi:hypothetical protein
VPVSSFAFTAAFRSQAKTLFTTPVIYLYLDRIRRRFEHGEDTPPPAVSSNAAS